MRCAKHNEETSVTCGRCETPVCPRCMVHTDVGVRCKTCAPVQTRPLSERLPLLSGGVGSILAIILVVALIGTGGSLLAGGGADDPADFYDDYVDELQAGEISASQIVDPWTPKEGDGAPAGRRFVAIELVIEADADAQYPYYVSPYTFQVKDEDDFVYGAVQSDASQAQPMFPSIELAAGERARGWVTFDVAEDAEIVALKAGTETVDLP